jgi:hypothetical protein
MSLEFGERSPGASYHVDQLEEMVIDRDFMSMTYKLYCHVCGKDITHIFRESIKNGKVKFLHKQGWVEIKNQFTFPFWNWDISLTIFRKGFPKDSPSIHRPTKDV